MKFGIRFTGFIAGRIFNYLFVVFLITLFIFWFSRLVGTDPSKVKSGYYQSPRPGATMNKDALQVLRGRMGLDLPLFYFSLKPSDKPLTLAKLSFNSDNQYHRWLFGNPANPPGGGILNGESGSSLMSGRSVFSMVADAFLITLQLTFLAFLLTVVGSVLFGVVLAARSSGSKLESIHVLMDVLYSIPIFWVVMLLLYFFSNPACLVLLPSSGLYPLVEGSGIWERISYFIIPLVALSYGSVLFFSRYLESGLRAEMEKAYFTTARAKGLKRTMAIFRHVFPNLLSSFLTLLVTSLPAWIGGMIILENMLSIPGVGWLMGQSLQLRDYPVTGFLFLWISTFSITVYAVSDLLINRLKEKAPF